MMYPNVQLHIAGTWRDASSGDRAPIINPATEEELGTHPIATTADLEEAAAATERGFKVWRATSPLDRSRVMRSAANLLRGRAEGIARVMTLEQGKPLFESRAELLLGADTIEWFAEEGRRTYGRLVPSREEGVLQLIRREPVGPVACFTPWNFPVNQAVRKLSAALCCGCSVILKGPEDTPASTAALVRAFLDAGVPGDVLSYVLGVPANISNYLIPHPVIRKISFTGSTQVGKHLASLAGQHMKRATMELGGHAPAIVFRDADINKAATILSANKFRNAGQVCVAPTRFLVHHSIFDEFCSSFTAAAESIIVGDGLSEGTQMGPLIGARRVAAMEAMVADAKAKGAEIRTGGIKIGNRGFFYTPTVLANVPLSAQVMNDEPFGPIAVINSFATDEEALVEANRLPFGLAAYAYTRSSATAERVSLEIESGMVSINHHGLGIPEVPFGGVKDSGYGSEGGSEALEGYLNSKFVSEARI
jgi:succinate-semialdehyde dehydrogenase/glutarate-semialdehyde dehydrogenase